MSPNNEIMYNIQSVFNLMPNLNVDSLAKAFVQHSNDIHLVIYISSIVRSIVLDRCTYVTSMNVTLSFHNCFSVALRHIGPLQRFF